ncbi:MAG TPA: outer membrane beta-barrel protein [Terriglobia bacterium]|nr:outer membrane beta-barrel protein [Terriglobia bacterium]
MRIRRFLQAVVVVVVLGTGAAALHAQDFSLFVMGGGSSLFDKKYYTVYGASYGSTYKTGSAFTVGGEIPLTKILGVEGSYGYVRNNLAVTDFYNSATPSNEIGYDILEQRVSADVVAHAPQGMKGVRPYLAGGVEYDRFAPTGTAAALAQSQGFNGVPNSVLSPEYKFGVNFGGGLDVKLTNLLAVRLDLRDHVTGSPTFGLPFQTASAYTAYYPIRGNTHNITLSAGFVFHFGK